MPQWEDSKRNASMASIVDRQAVKPDCWGRRRRFSRVRGPGSCRQPRVKQLSCRM